MSTVYQFFEKGVPTDSPLIHSYACKACASTDRKKKTFRAQLEVNSNLINHCISFHENDAFWIQFKKQDKENNSPAVNTFIIF